MGLGFALLARDRLRADGPFVGPPFLLVLMHAGVVAAVALYFYAAHPAWSWLYVVDPDSVPWLALIPMMVAHGLLVIGGWYGGAMLVRTDRRPILMYAAAGVSLLFIILVIAARRRLGASATYAGWKAGVGRDLLDVELGYALITSLMATAGSAVFIVLELLRDGRRVRTR
jgi:hypothetical protein